MKCFHECLIIDQVFLDIFSDFRPLADFEFLSIMEFVKRLNHLWLFQANWTTNNLQRMFNSKSSVLLIYNPGTNISK